MKKTLFILCALLLTAVGASAQGYVTSITNTTATWMGATGLYPSTGNGGVERYQTTNYTAGKVLYQSIAGLSAGTYQVTFYAVASSTSGRGFYNIYGENIAQVFANGTTQDVEVYDQTGITGDLSTYSYTLTCTVGVDGILEYGLQNIAAGGNWYVCQGVSYTCTAESSPTVNVGDLHVCEAEIGHWTTTGNNGTFVLNDWSVENDESGMKVPFCQNWVWEGEEASVLLTTAKISHAPFNNLPAGFYEVSIDIRIFSEAGNEIGTGTTFNVNNESEDLDKTDIDGHEGTYGDATEVYGTYTLIAEVTETDGTLDISIQLPTTPTYNWIAWKNLKVEYLGETLEYEIHEPKCSAKVVQPGDEVSIVYECATPDTSKEPTLDATKSITVGTATVTIDEEALDCKGYSATVTFTVPESITVGEDITISVPEGLIYWDKDVTSETSNVLSPAATFTVHTPATIAGGDYLIMNAEGNYLGGGLAWGTQAVTIGKPQFIGFGKQDDGTYHLDSHQYNGSDNHYLSADLWFDSATPADWTLVSIGDGYALYYAETDRYVTDNGFQEAATLSAEPTVWTLVTIDDVVASMATATEDSPVDVTALIKAPELKRNSNTSYYPTWTVTGYDGTGTPSNYQFGDPNGAVANCGESYHSTNGFNFSQEITLPLAGTYTLSAKGFYSGTAASGDTTPVLYAGNQTSTFPVLATNATSMADAYIEFLEGMNGIEAITITTTSNNETVTIGFKGADTSLWNIMGELELLCLDVVEETNYAYDVTWKLANPSFEVDNVVENLTVDDGRGYSVTTLTGWDLSSSEVDHCDLMTKEATETDNNLGVPSAAADGDYWLYLKKTWGDSEGSASVKQKVTLPAGDYKLTVQSMAFAASATATLVAGEASKSITINGTSAGSETSHPIAELTEWTTNELVFTVDTEEGTDVELGVDFTFPTGAIVGSILIDNFKLYSVDAIEETIKWTMTDAGWGTLILPFDASIPSGLTAYSCDGTTTDDETETTTVNLTEVNTGITANTPYIIGGSVEYDTEYTFKGTPTNKKEIYTSDADGVSLTGTLVDLAVAKGAAFTLDGTEYLLQHHDGVDDSAAFYPIIENDSKDATLDAYHCYLTLDENSSPSGARVYIGFPGSGEATGIVAIEGAEAEGNGAIYDLSGRKVSKAVKGVYIQNGKKVLVK